MGHLIRCGLLSRQLVRRYIIKPPTCHYYYGENFEYQEIGANAIYNLFTAAGNTLLQGFLEPEDIQVCFERLKTRIRLGQINGVGEWDAANLDV